MFLQEVHHIFKNALSHDECDHICSLAHAEELKSRSTRWDSKHRRSSYPINDNQVVESITQKIFLANAESFKFQLSTIEPLQYSRYDIDDHYNLHIDSHFDAYENPYDTKTVFYCNTK